MYLYYATLSLEFVMYSPDISLFNLVLISCSYLVSLLMNALSRKAVSDPVRAGNVFGQIYI